MNHEKDLKKSFVTWCEAINKRNPKKILELYDPAATLLPTLQPNIIKDQSGIFDYFSQLMNNPKLQVKIIDSDLRFVGDLAINSGRYTFSFEREGNRVDLPARFTFIYVKIADRWQIIEHHSSQIPELSNRIN